MLAVRELHAFYGKSHILHGVSLTVGNGEIVSLLGRNGVGRSTTCKAIMGLVPPQGEILFKGRNIAGLRTDLIAHAGIGYVPEDRQIFPTLTLRQNLELGLKRPNTFGRWTFDDLFCRAIAPRAGGQIDVAGALALMHDRSNQEVIAQQEFIVGEQCPLIVRRQPCQRANHGLAGAGGFVS